MNPILSNIVPESLEEAARLVQAKQISATELTTNSLAALARLNPLLNITIRIEPEALAQARAVDEQLAQGNSVGPLAGIPLAHKDLFRRGDAPVSCGSRIGWFDLADGVRAPSVATSVARLRAAGAIEVGALAMVEFAIGPTGHNSSFGNTLNPWDPARIPGGSSSGSAVAVSTGAVFGSLGTDTGGSIRQPAHYCGIVGLKPTQGLISRAGAFPAAATLDTVGPLARTVRDCALLTEIIAGPDLADSACRNPAPDLLSGIENGVAGLRVGVACGGFLEGVDRRIRELVEEFGHQLQDLGAQTIPIPMNGMAPISAAANTVSAVELAAVHHNMLAMRPDDYPPLVRVRVERAQQIPADMYHQSKAARETWRKRFIVDIFSRCDILLLPTVDSFALRYDEFDLQNDEAILQIVARLTRLNRPFNYLDLPSLAMPMKVAKGELPAAVQIVGPPFSEPVLFRSARSYEKLTGSTQAHPPISVWS